MTGDKRALALMHVRVPGGATAHSRDPALHPEGSGPTTDTPSCKDERDDRLSSGSNTTLAHQREHEEKMPLLRPPRATAKAGNKWANGPVQSKAATPKFAATRNLIHASG